jgi:predicted metal-dependent phosphoesterase TrpH
MPGYEPFLLCDFHTHTTWSDGRLSIRGFVYLYGQTGSFDVIAITDHILRKHDVLSAAARVATFGRRQWSVVESSFAEYLGEIAEEAQRARRLYGMLVLPGAEITKNHVRAKKNAHIIALGIREFISADDSTEDILKEIRRQGALSIACHPHHRTTRRIELSTCYLWDHRDRLVDMVDLWEAANRDDLFSVTSLKHFPYIASSDFHRPKHLYSWKTLVRSRKDWPSLKTALRHNLNLAITLYRGESWVDARARAAGVSLDSGR